MTTRELKEAKTGGSKKPGQRRKTPSWVYKPAKSPFWWTCFDVDGKTHSKNTYTRNRRAAEKIAREHRAEVLAARAARPPVALKGDLTFSQAAELYWNDIGRHSKKSGQLDADLERIVLMVGPERMCSTITSKDRIDIRTRLRDGIRPPGIGNRGRPLKDPNTYGTKRINDYSDLIPRIIHHAEVMRETTFNLRRERRHPGDSDREKEGVRHRKLKFEEQRRLEKVMDRDLADMVLFDLETGMREEALCTLTWGQIEWSLCEVTFPLKTNKRDPVMHTVDLTEEAMAILYRRLAMHEAEGVGVTSDDRVFMLRLLKDNTLNGKTRHAGDLVPVSPRLLIDRFRKACDAALIDDLVVHDLRRTAGRRVYDEEGSDIEAARAFLGHVDIETTKRYLGVKGTSINKHLRRRSARARLAKAELDKAAANAGAAPGTREHALHLVVGGRNGPGPTGVA